jgi:hypothetical protein
MTIYLAKTKTIIELRVGMKSWMRRGRSRREAQELPKWPKCAKGALIVYRSGQGQGRHRKGTLTSKCKIRIQKRVRKVAMGKVRAIAIAKINLQNFDPSSE